MVKLGWPRFALISQTGTVLKRRKSVSLKACHCTQLSGRKSLLINTLSRFSKFG